MTEATIPAAWLSFWDTFNEQKYKKISDIRMDVQEFEIQHNEDE